MLSYAFLDSKVSHTLGGSQNPSSRAILMYMSCLPDLAGETPQGKGMLAEGIMQVTAWGSELCRQQLLQLWWAEGS